MFDDDNFKTVISGPFTRRRALTVAAAGLAAAALPRVARAQTISFPYYPELPSGAYTPESIPDIVTNILTQDYLHAAFSAALVLNPALAATMGTNSGLPLAHFQALAAIHQDHIDFWTALFPEAQPVTAFTAPPALLASPQALFPAGEAVDSLRAATLIAAVREFAELGQPTLARFAAQQVAIEGGIWAGLRFLEVLGGSTAAVPPVDKAFATSLVLYTRDATTILRELGLIGGDGVPVAYPGREAMLKAAGPMEAVVVQTEPGAANSTVEIGGLSSLTAPRS